MIPNIYHLFYYKKYEDIDIISFFGIKSIIEINNPEIIYFYYDYLPNGNLWNRINSKLTLKKIIIPKKFINNEEEYFKLYKYPLIYKELKNYGGIYIDINCICINPIKELFNNSFLKSKNNEIIMSEKNNDIIIKYYDFYLNNILFDESNVKLLDLKYNTNNNVFTEIFDYSFGEYFHLIKNCYFISLSCNNNFNITIHDIFNKITTYNLLVRNALTYNLFINEYILNNNSELINNSDLINNIDVIYWINLEKSDIRRNNTNKLLNSINIPNNRIIAHDGSIEDNISIKYFNAENNIYPNYNNKEYAILLSHLNTIEKYSNTNFNNIKYGVAMICEDDLSFNFMNYWNKDIKTIVEDAPNDWDIIMLGYFSLNINRKEEYQKWDNEWSAICYLINYNSIQKINSLKKEDKWICNENDLMVSDNYIFSKFNTYVYKYPYITFPNNNDSTFHSDHLDYHRLYKISNYMVLENMYDNYNAI